MQTFAQENMREEQDAQGCDLADSAGPHLHTREQLPVIPAVDEDLRGSARKQSQGRGGITHKW